jgi:hypothetical protein
MAISYWKLTSSILILVLFLYRRSTDHTAQKTQLPYFCRGVLPRSCLANSLSADHIQHTFLLLGMRVYSSVAYHWPWCGPHRKHFLQDLFYCYIYKTTSQAQNKYLAIFPFLWNLQNTQMCYINNVTMETKQYIPFLTLFPKFSSTWTQNCWWRQHTPAEHHWNYVDILRYLLQLPIFQ